MERKRHFHNAGWSGLSALIRAILGVLTSLIALRLLGVTQYGLVATWMSLFVLYLSLNTNAFTVLVVKLVGKGNRNQEFDRQLATSAATYFCLISLSILIAITLSLMALLGYIARFPEIFPSQFGLVILLMGMLTGVQICVALQAAVIEGAGRLDLASRAQLVGPAFVSGTLVINLLSNSTIETWHFISILAAGALVDMLLLFLVRRNLALPLHVKGLRANYWRGVLNLLRSGGILQAASLLNLFLEPANKLILGSYSGVAAVAVYDLAMKVIWGIQHLFGAVMRVFLHIGNEDRRAVGKSFAKAIVLLAVPAVAMHIFGILFLYWVGRIWVKIDASSLMFFFGVASVSNLVMILITPLYISLVGRGEWNFIFKLHVLLAVANLSLSMLLVPVFGLVGSGFGLLVATVVNGLAIYNRCVVERQAILIEGDVLRGVCRRVVMSLGLLVAALLWSVFEGGGWFGLMVITLGLSVLIYREPLLMRLIDFFLSRAK